LDSLNWFEGCFFERCLNATKVDHVELLEDVLLKAPFEDYLSARLVSAPWVFGLLALGCLVRVGCLGDIEGVNAVKDLADKLFGADTRLSDAHFDA